MSSIEEQIAKAQREADQVKARLQRLRSRKAADERKIETRTKIILGAAVLAYLEKRPVVSANQMRAVISGYLSEKDRVFLAGLLTKMPEPPRSSET